MPLMQFTNNYNDESTDRGFQFVFYCDRCNNGYRTTFQPSAVGNVSAALDAASGLLGGVLGRAASAGDSIRSAGWQKAHDAAFQKAVEEAMPHFHKCKRCGNWVDDDCWNPGRTMCKDCAPDLQEEYSNIQVQAAINDARTKAANVSYTSEDAFKETIVAHCPNCGASVSGGKFCPECGQPLAETKFCTECGSKIEAGVKFCPECGAAQS